MKQYSNAINQKANLVAKKLAGHATCALLDEARLTPKPGLVDNRGSGAHTDLSLELMERSAYSLKTTFYALALQGWQRPIDIALRGEVGRVGREGERQMMVATGGVNTHRGSIWALGLLVTAVAMIGEEEILAEQAVALASSLACLPDHASPKIFSKGLCASRRYHVPGAREEAEQGFPHIMKFSLPELRLSRNRGVQEQHAQLNALMAIMSSLTDTCVLSRGGMSALRSMQKGAKAVLQAGGVSEAEGWQALMALDKQMLIDNVSPGGAADLLAATLFLDRTTIVQ